MTRKAKPIPDHMKGRDWLMTQDWSDEEIELALDTADQLKDEFKSGVPTLAPRTQNGVPYFLRQVDAHTQLVRSRHDPARRARAFHRFGNIADRAR